MKRTRASTLASKLAHKVITKKRILDQPETNKKASHASNCHQSQDTTVTTTPKPQLKELFYDQECITLAKSLLGKVLVHKHEGERLTGRIVETEVYLGTIDAACHTYKGRRSDRNEAMWMDPGTAYVYLTYGMYHCVNISSRGEGCAVLLRALEPLEGLATMQKHRSSKRADKKPLKPKDLCNGPGKLSMSLHLTRQLHDRCDMCSSNVLWVEEGRDIAEEDIVSCPRIGIDSVPEEWRNKPFRFYEKGNINVSKRNKDAEAKMEDSNEELKN